MNKVFLTVSLFLVSMLGYCQSIFDKTIQNSDFQINYSNNWKLDETGRNNTAFYLIYNPVAEEFGNNINLLVQNLEGMNIDLDLFTKISEEQIIANGNLISSKRLVKNNIPFQELEFELSFNGLDLFFVQNYFIQNEKGYVLTLTVIKDKKSELIKEGREILNSFTLK